MVNRIKTTYPRGLNKALGSKFCMGSRVRHEILDNDEDNSPNTLIDKNYQASSQKFRQITNISINLFYVSTMAQIHIWSI